MKHIVIFILVTFIWVTGSIAQDTLVVQDGSCITVTYTASINDEIIDTASPNEPLTFVLGEKTMIDGFEQGIIGMKKGESKTFVVTPENAYGLHDPQAYITLKRSQLPENTQLHEGSVIMLPALDNYPVTVKKMDNDTVILDANHKLAGKEITFSVTIMDVE